MNDFPMRINKYLAHKGWSTRRGADELILKKKVLINGVVAQLGDKILRDDKVEVLGGTKTVKSDYFAFYKGPDESANEVESQLSAFIKKTGLFVANQLDKDSEGLVIVTNDGRLTDKLLHGDYEREYIVETTQAYKPTAINKIAEGIYIDKDKTKPAKVELMDDRVFKITLREENHNQIRRMLSNFDIVAKKIRRSRIANIRAGKMVPGNVYPIQDRELQTFLHEVGVRQPQDK